MERYAVKNFYKTETSVSNLLVDSFTYDCVTSFSNFLVLNAELSNTAAPLAIIQLDLNVGGNFVSGKITNIKSLNGSLSSRILNISNDNFVDNSFIDDTNDPALHQG